MKEELLENIIEKYGDRPEVMNNFIKIFNHQ